VNRRRVLPVVLSAVAACTTLSSCSTFNRNDVAARVGDDELTAQEAQDRVVAEAGPAGSDDRVTDGAQLRSALTSWIKEDVLATMRAQPGFDDQVRALYEQGLGGSPVLCLAAIPVGNIDATVTIMSALQAGTSFADAAKQFSSDPTFAESGGVVVVSGSECLPPDGLNPAIADALQSTPVGEPVAADLGDFAAVLMLRPYDELSQDYQAVVTAASIGERQLAQLYVDAGIYIDPRYGRWDPLSQSVQPLRT
jgi:hypothetical protein